MKQREPKGLLAVKESEHREIELSDNLVWLWQGLMKRYQKTMGSR